MPAAVADGAPIALKRSEPDQDPAILDGLNPKHTKIDENDPLLHMHRFQHHDAASNRLTYLQYEARRHEHVVVLGDLNVTFCTYEPDEENSTLLWLTLDVSNALFDSANLTLGSIVVGDAANCTALGGEMREVLRDRVLGRAHLRERRERRRQRRFRVEQARAPLALPVLGELRGAVLGAGVVVDVARGASLR